MTEETQHNEQHPQEEGAWQGVGRSFDTLPVWAKVMFIFGFPTVVALFYMGQDAGMIPSIHKEQTVAIINLGNSLKEHRSRQEELISDINVGLRVICENSATDSHGTPIQPHFNNCKNIK